LVYEVRPDRSRRHQGEREQRGADARTRLLVGHLERTGRGRIEEDDAVRLLSLGRDPRADDRGLRHAGRIAEDGGSRH
jgi:hypothetical protein